MMNLNLSVVPARRCICGEVSKVFSTVLLEQSVSTMNDTAFLMEAEHLLICPELVLKTKKQEDYTRD